MNAQVRKQRGQSLVEFALVLPLLILLLGGVLELGRLFFAYVAVTDAAAEGATYASIYPRATIHQITERAQAASGGLIQLDPSMVQVQRPVLTAGAPITVTVTYPFRLITPLLGDLVPGRTIPLRGVAVGVILSNP
ncbi:MAG: pilus assembly protein [Chloroflexi bacterium]|nr:pilus assembly protein [Chloroflexota bacterium]